MLDHDADLFTVIDLKQYAYCPRIFYYHACLPDIRPTTYKMRLGLEVHTDESKRALRRSLDHLGIVDGERTFDVALQSTALMLSGKIDEVVTTDQEMIPIDYKMTRKAGFHFKIQLTAYALLLEEAHRARVDRSFLYLIPLRKMEEVPITPKLRRQVRQMIDEMRRIAATERMPDATDWRQRCADCEFRRFCNDV